ncbi:dihydrolipoyl dehydrogenase [Candidatus Finniella inopinata]|uniref:Dihydrolipoyl dehydrogenase n=1 Tax=Candidatus Finniella inopinata TaxID=1696036 RepID=A0A4Q7DK60_9PROT|nr:dihydrolipoyl dehydrogenase [Candidatus Finniella inopinata]RZI46760.1 dihydrolipoyl dehydrogenase [Candidatus Finniella inopinata]
MSAFDLVIVGSGPAGYVSAIRASQLGFKTAVVERDQLGGICLNWGCIPTKALLRSAEIKHLIDHAQDFGFKIDTYQVDLNKIVERSRRVANQLAGGIHHLLKKNKVTVFKGYAQLEKPGLLQIKAEDGKVETITADHIILATGARARLLPNMPTDHPLVWTAKQAMVPSFLPKSLLIVGSGAIGIEFASFYRTMGSEVTVVEMQDRILPQEDEEISALAQKSFEKQGMQFLLKTTVSNLDAGEKTVKAVLESADKPKKTIEVDAVIVAIGVVGNTENLGLEHTKVKVDRGQIEVDQWSATAEPGIYSIGDVAGAPWLAHKASHQGIICVEKIAKLDHVHPLKVNNIPGCTYSLPQIASIGLTEAKAKAEGFDVKVGRFPFMGNGKAIAMGEAEGLVKTIFDANTGEFLGAHMIGAEVTELIQGFALAKSLETTEAEMMHTIFPHPTLSEMMHESVLDAYGRVIHF